VGRRSGGNRLEINQSHMDFSENGYQTCREILKTKVRPLLREEYHSNNL
jgi:hypothetical protein